MIFQGFLIFFKIKSIAPKNIFNLFYSKSLDLRDSDS